MNTNRVLEVRIKHIEERQPDLSYLTGHCAGPEYEAEDNERIRRYNNGDWYMMGIRAEADIKIKLGETYVISTISSGGLWGIESDSDEQYIKEIERVELNDLKALVTQMGLKFPEHMEITRKQEIEA